MKQITIDQFINMGACAQAIILLRKIFPEGVVPITQESLDRVIEAGEIYALGYMCWMGDVFVGESWTTDVHTDSYRFYGSLSTARANFMGKKVLERILAYSDEEFYSLIEMHIQEDT